MCDLARICKIVAGHSPLNTLVYSQCHVERIKKKGDIETRPRGVYTSPAKRGSYGVRGTTISEHKGYKGTVSIMCITPFQLWSCPQVSIVTTPNTPLCEEQTLALWTE